MLNDWSTSFVPAALLWLTGGNPYAAPQPFASPPWSLFVLAPLAWVPAWLAMLLPMLALGYCAYRLRKPHLIALVGLSWPFIAGTLYANVDWLVMLGAVMGGPLGAIMVTIKPQAGVFAIVGALSQRTTWRARARLLVPLVILALLTLPLYDAWLAGMRTISMETGTLRNFSLFPYSIPAGLILLVIAWRRQSVLAGVAASLALAPYWYIHSLMPLLFLVSAKDWRYGLAFNAALWGLLALIVTHIIPTAL